MKPTELRTMRNPSFAIFDNDDSVNRPKIGDTFTVVSITPGVLDMHWEMCTVYELQQILGHETP